MPLPIYPDFVPINLGMKDSLYPLLNLSTSGISEFTFAGLYLFRDSYQYRIAQIPNETCVISGLKAGQSFFCTPCAVPSCGNLDRLFASHDFYRHLSEEQVGKHQCALECLGLDVREDRDQFAYLYSRKDL